MSLGHNHILYISVYTYVEIHAVKKESFCALPVTAVYFLADVESVP